MKFTQKIGDYYFTSDFNGSNVPFFKTLIFGLIFYIIALLFVFIGFSILAFSANYLVSLIY